MSLLGTVFMVLICGLVWGGFWTLLLRMVIAERRKPPV